MKTSEMGTSELNPNVLRIVNELSQSSSLISQSAKSKLTGVFALELTDLVEPKTFSGKVTGYALIVNTYNVRATKRDLGEIKHLEVTTDAELYDNNLPKNCYRVRWTVQMLDNSVGACPAMRGSDKVTYGNDVVVTLSKSSFNNVTFIKSVINKR